MYCETCHERLKTGARKCPSCGHAVQGSRDLGTSSVRDAPIATSYSLPPAPKLIEEKPPVAVVEQKPPVTAVEEKPPVAVVEGTPKVAMVEEKPKVAEVRPASQKPQPSPVAAKPNPPKQPAPRPRRSEPSGAEPHFDLSPARIRDILIERPELIEEGLSIHADRDAIAAGARFETSVGTIDLLARDRAAGWVVVMVAEAGQGKEIVGDLLQLIGWVRKHLSSEGQEVRGVVLVESAPENLGYAAAAVSDTVEFKRYRLGLTLEKIDV